VKAAKTCASRAESAFADGRVYLERYLERPRHIEVQVVRDGAGTCIALGNRECSVQRRHQKVIEEAPSPAAFFQGDAGKARLERVLGDACRLLSAADYLGVGTVEFIADARGDLFFLEVNARLQVEHPVTEAVTGLDLVELQLRIASGETPLAGLGEIARRGHAVEARLYAEDPDKGFIPQPGRLERVEFPSGLEGVRVDTGVESGMEVTPHYDPLIAKVVGIGANRDEAIARLDRALAATRLELNGPKGPRKTNLEFLRRLLDSDEFRRGEYDTNLTTRVLEESARPGA
jgi:acetyl/propionyl-CoA carboxylase alpha subunit